MDACSSAFKNNEIIWGKVTGHPWWPGVISTTSSSPHSELYHVDFFGYPPTHSLLPLGKIVKYQQYYKINSSELSGRVSPGLRRAISQASILFQTIQQSKNSPLIKNRIQGSIQTQNLAYSATKSEQKFKLNRKMMRKTLQNQKLQAKQKKMRIKKMRKGKKQYDITISRQQRQYQRKLLESRVEQMLTTYKLRQIPSINIQKQGHNAPKIVKLLYRICRRHFLFSRDDSIQIAQREKGKVHNIRSLNKLLSILMGLSGNNIYQPSQ